jgi:hypothetical protein
MRQSRESPVRHRGYREGEVVAELSSEIKKPQKGAQRSSQFPRRRLPTQAGSFQNKISKGPCIPLANIVSEPPE